jgi:hypothetical protein
MSRGCQRGRARLVLEVAGLRAVPKAILLAAIRKPTDLAPTGSADLATGCVLALRLFPKLRGLGGHGLTKFTERQATVRTERRSTLDALATTGAVRGHRSARDPRSNQGDDSNADDHNHHEHEGPHRRIETPAEQASNGTDVLPTGAFRLGMAGHSSLTDTGTWGSARRCTLMVAVAPAASRR